MRLLDAYSHADAAAFLYRLFCERPQESWISREGMVSFEEHKRFFQQRPFRYWLLIEHDGELVGAIEVADRNEIGIAIKSEWRGRGLGRLAVEAFVLGHEPLPAIPAIRNGRWLANIACGNESSKAFFRKMGFQPIQETWAL